MESGDTATATQLHNRTRSNTIPAQNKNGVRQGGSTVGMALSCISITFFFGERHYAGQKEADLCRNDDKYPSRFWVMPVLWRRRRRWWRKSGFSSFTYVIVAVYFTNFESVIVSGNTLRPCYISKRAYSCRVREFWAVIFEGLMGVSAPSLHRESTDSLIGNSVQDFWAILYLQLMDMPALHPLLSP